MLAVYCDVIAKATLLIVSEIEHVLEYVKSTRDRNNEICKQRIVCTNAPHLFSFTARFHKNNAKIGTLHVFHGFSNY